MRDRERNRQGVREAYKTAKSAGICVTCHAADAVDGHVFCAVCKKKMDAYQDRRRKYFRENGLCLQCGNPISGGLLRCSVCLDKRRQYRSKRYQALKDAGLCVRCGSPRGQNGTTILCWSCALYRRQYDGIPRDSDEYRDMMREMAARQPRNPVTKNGLKDARDGRYRRVA